MRTEDGKPFSMFSNPAEEKAAMDLEVPFLGNIPFDPRGRQRVMMEYIESLQIPRANCKVIHQCSRQSHASSRSNRENTRQYQLKPSHRGSIHDVDTGT